jgi:hypothetical protein
MSAPANTLAPVESSKILHQIMQAISSIDEAEFRRLSTADDIDDLSANTVFDSIEASPDTIFQRPDKGFEASAVVYVTLNYGGKRDAVSMPDSYPAVIEGKLSGDRVKIEKIRVDTSSFYE